MLSPFCEAPVAAESDFPSLYQAAKGPSVQQKALKALRHEVDVAVAAAGISVMGSVDHMSGGTFVVDSSSDSDGNEKSGLVYDVSVVTFAGAANRCAWTHWQALSSPSLCLALAFWVEFFY